jgi:hypothetical protein
MPRDGAVVLSDLRSPTLSILCEPCSRRGSYNVARLMAQRGDARLTDLLQTLANCPKARSASIHDRSRRFTKGWPYRGRKRSLRGVRRIPQAGRVTRTLRRAGVGAPAAWSPAAGKLRKGARQDQHAARAR